MKEWLKKLLKQITCFKNISVHIDLTKFTEKELCQIYDSLNKWEWNSKLGSKPEEWDELPRFHKPDIKEKFFNSKFKIISPITSEIRNKVGETKLVKWHWINNLNRTEDEFNEWLSMRMSDAFLRF